MKICSVHKKPSIWNDFDANGKHYAFWGCPTYKETKCKAEQIEDVDLPSDSLKREKVGEPDWDEIAKGKVRHGVVVAIIEHGGIEELNKEFFRINSIVDYIMSGKMPAKE